MNLGVGRVQNVTANNIFLRDKSLYEFIDSAKGKSYTMMPEYCDEYFEKKKDKKYFGQIITPINLLGMIQTDNEEIIVENQLLKHVLKARDERLAKYYMNYFLCMWQYPIPSTKAAYGRNMEVFKPYCLLLKMLLELYNVNPKESYLSTYDFSYLFLEPDGEMPMVNDIDTEYAKQLIDTRLARKARGISQENGSLTYIINTLDESDLLTKDAMNYPDVEDYYIGLISSESNLKVAEFIIRTYNDKWFHFNPEDPSGVREVMSDYGKYINNIEKFERWKSCYMNISRIGEFNEFCSNKGFYYTEDLVRRFVLSLEAKPFLLLTGISGSGKTKIAELWIEYLQSKNEAEGMQIAVGSNWTDSKKLLGFNNVLLEKEDAYQETALVQLIKRANDNSNKEFIVILDEMNLSRVEMYFADFLSALESRKHSITLPDGGEVYWSNNLKIIGTVNVDESTYMFSPKVLDRANVIEMNGMSPKAYINAVKEKNDKIYKDIEDSEWYEEFVEILDEVYKDLNGEFAYRVVDEISKYMALNTMLFGNDVDKALGYLDEQISQKILPKLHGSKAQLKPKLDRLQESFENDERFVLVNTKIEKMQEDVKKGYASFIGD